MKPTVYVAASYSKDRLRAKAFIKRLNDAGYSVTHDWTDEMPPKVGTSATVHRAINRRQAADDLTAAAAADVIVLLYSSGMRGAWIEVGAGLNNLVKVLVVGQPEQAESFVFLDLMSGVVANEDEAMEWLSHQRAEDLE